MSVCTAAAPVSVDAQDQWLDTSDRQAVIDAFDREFDRDEPTIDWTGSASACLSGQTSIAYRHSVYQRINYFRAMAGVRATISENTALVAAAHQMALMSAATGELSHHPDNSFACHTSEGAAAAGISNLYLGLNGLDAIDGYVRDDNVPNVGHRNVLFHPSTRLMATGDVPASESTPAANTLVAFDHHIFDNVSTRDGFIAWPPPGYVPAPLVHPYWSLAVDGADFTDAMVTATRNNTAVPVVVHHRGKGEGSPFPAITWTPSDLELDGSTDQVLDVSVTGTTVAGEPRVFSYQVIILGQQAVPVANPTNRDQNRLFINQAHQDFLGRPATHGELEKWATRLTSGTSRFVFVNELAASPEWTSFVVNQLYVDTLGRSPDEAGRAYWIAQLQSGTPVAKVAAIFYGSPEYVARHGNSFERWIADLYLVLLDRPVDEGGLGYWTDLADRDGPGAVAYQLYQSDESRSTRVMALYQRFLGRNPDAAGLKYWIDALANGDDLQLAADLATSDEYFQRSR